MMANVRGFESFFATLDEKLEPPVKTHLKNVYSSLSLSLISAAAGGYVHMFTNVLKANIWMSLIGLAFIGLLLMTPDNGKNRSLRMLYLLGFAFVSGLTLGPLMDAVIRIDPSIVATAFMATSLLFICFTLSALYSNQRRWLYLAGTLSSALSMMIFLGFMNIFFQSQLLFQIYIYGGFAMVCGFVLYDTQMIIEKRRNGDRDFIWHSVLLFVDFIDMFRHLLIILSQREQQKKKNDK